MDADLARFENDLKKDSFGSSSQESSDEKRLKSKLFMPLLLVESKSTGAECLPPLPPKIKVGVGAKHPNNNENVDYCLLSASAHAAVITTFCSFFMLS